MRIKSDTWKDRKIGKLERERRADKSIGMNYFFRG